VLSVNLLITSVGISLIAVHGGFHRTFIFQLVAHFSPNKKHQNYMFSVSSQQSNDTQYNSSFALPFSRSLLYPTSTFFFFSALHANASAFDDKNLAENEIENEK
jgi:hypothetical protein